MCSKTQPRGHAATQWQNLMPRFYLSETFNLCALPERKCSAHEGGNTTAGSESRPGFETLAHRT
jgi:hypothetical protein